MIEPALTAEEWADVKQGRGLYSDDDGDFFAGHWQAIRVTDRPHAMIAVLNAALPDFDPRKITREWVRYARDAAHAAEARHDRTRELGDYECQSMFERIADALESYLPPE